MDDTDGRLIVLDPADTVAVARCPVAAGTRLTIGGRDVVLDGAITIGHKLARRAMRPGDKVLKYGVSIGSATAEIAVGAHVHLHNMKSDYTPTHTRTGEAANP
ncbi:altronate hydrolase [Rhodobacteraceae bacterium CCMM004]|nr:altronate hydrolase [Rhodobacteraceae bacterium CCMM004]